MNPRTLVGVVALVSGLAVVSAGAQEKKSAVTFRSLDLEAALAAAKAEDKFVLIDFFTTWCAPCKLLDQNTWTDAKVGDLVNAKAVALKLDAEKEGRAAAKRYAVAAYPTLLVLKPDGTEVDRIIGYREPARFIADFSGSIAGRPTLVRAQAAVATATVSADSRETVRARYDLAKTLAQSGKSAEALEHFLWCYDVGMVQVASYVGVRNSFLTGDMGRLAAKYPPAREALVTRRDEAKVRLLGGDARATSDFAALNDALGDHYSNISTFEQLPAGDPRRRAFGTRLMPVLISTRRYAEAIDAMPAAAVLRLAESTLTPNGPNGKIPGARLAAIRGQMRYVEMLAGGGDLASAQALVGKILAFDSSAETRALLRAAVERAERPELLAEIAEKP